MATAAALVLPAGAWAAGEAVPLKHVDWHHGGVFGTFDRAEVQRGLQVYKEVCASCHGLKYVAFRALESVGLSEAQVKAFAAGYTVQDGPNDSGDMFERPGRASDKFPSPFPNEKAARAANGGAYPPDLSLLIKARAGAENYMYSLLTGYKPAPAGFQLGQGMNYNEFFPGHQIAMPQPLNDGQVTYADGTNASVDQMAKDVTAFLAWAAEPNLEDRKRLGIKVILFLIVLSGLFYAAKRKVWADVH